MNNLCDNQQVLGNFMTKYFSCQETGSCNAKFCDPFLVTIPTGTDSAGKPDGFRMYVMESNLISVFHSLGRLSKESVQVRGPLEVFVTSFFLRRGLLTPRPTPKLEGHPLLSVRDYLFNIFAANLHCWRPLLLLERWDRVMWTGFVWLMIGTGGELL
jgi:hypothetical protein